MPKLIAFSQTDHQVSLQAFSQGSFTADFEISKSQLVLQFNWPPEWELKNAEPGEKLTRAHEIWKSTCFEAFIKPKNQRHYWEINLSPKKLWNIYKFKDYRESLPQLAPTEEKEWNILDLKSEPGSLLATIKHGLPMGVEVNIGLCAILESELSEKSFWAVKHSLKKPDYHDAATFVLEGKIK